MNLVGIKHMIKKKVYHTMNDVPIGTEMIHRGKRGKLIELHNFPTMFKVEFEDGSIDLFLTHEIEIVGWPPND